MKNAFIFPGQGAQKIGMGRELATVYPSAREVFQIVDDALGENLSSLIWDGDLNELTLTENAQPALMASSIAILAAMESEGFEITFADFVAGHSLGEYTALCASKAISIADTAKLLRVRGEAMQSCDLGRQGAMAVVLGLNVTELQDVVDEASGFESCQIANDNDPSQVVISGYRSAVMRAIEIAKIKGAKKALSLNVSAPFHSKMMQPAAEKMQEALEGIAINIPKVPIVMNTQAKAVVDPGLIRGFLVDQVVGMVRWRESVTYMIDNGVSGFYELGVGKVLSGMIKRIASDKDTFNIASPTEVSSIWEIIKNVAAKR